MLRSVRQVRSFPSLRQATAYQASVSPQLQQQRSLASTVLLTSWTQARVPDLKEELKKRGLSTCVPYGLPISNRQTAETDTTVLHLSPAAPARRLSSLAGSRNTRAPSPRCPRPGPPRPRLPRRSPSGSPTARSRPSPATRSRPSTAPSGFRPRCVPDSERASAAAKEARVDLNQQH